MPDPEYYIEGVTRRKKGRIKMNRVVVDGPERGVLGLGG